MRHKPSELAGLAAPEWSLEKTCPDIAFFGSNAYPGPQNLMLPTSGGTMEWGAKTSGRIGGRQRIQRASPLFDSVRGWHFYKCPRHHRIKLGAAHFIFPWPQFEAARRATWHARSEGLPQLKSLISLPPWAWFGRRGSPGIDSAESCRNSYAVGLVLRAAEVCRGHLFVIALGTTEAFFGLRGVGERPACRTLMACRNNSGGAHLTSPSLLALPQALPRCTA
jgi:hypothetical protein